jgi:hypothetical protein
VSGASDIASALRHDECFFGGGGGGFGGGGLGAGGLGASFRSGGSGCSLSFHPLDMSDHPFRCEIGRLRRLLLALLCFFGSGLFLCGGPRFAIALHLYLGRRLLCGLRDCS